MEHLLIKEIPYQSCEYHLEVALRDKILRRPLGLSLYEEKLDHEKEDIHLGAFQNGTLLGVLILTKLDHGDFKMRQVAVEEMLQGKGIGKRLVLHAENYARQKGAKGIILHARKTAVAFYEKLGYQTIGEEFIEVKLPHKKMFKTLSTEAQQ